MSQSIQDEQSHPSRAAEHESLASEPSPNLSPQSNIYGRAAPESCLSELATSIGNEISLDEAMSRGLAVLSILLPDCSAEIRESSNAQSTSCSPSEAPRSGEFGSQAVPDRGSNRLPGRCEWRLSENADGPVLVVSLRQIRQPREVARILDLGERVARILAGAVQRERSRQRLLAQAEEVRDLQRRLIQAEKLAGYGQLVASTLHDLNNPLTAILAYAEYFARALRSAGAAEADLERIARLKEAAETVLRQTRGLVEYACPPSAPFTSIDLIGVVRRATELCEHEFHRAGIGVRTTFASNLLAVTGHSEHLTQLFVNLFTNAAHAALPANAELSIEATIHEDPAWVLVRVHDNGPGIQPSDIERVFEPFYTTRRGSGCGLGLSIVRDIVNHHGGQISVESAPHVGTTFSLLLPAARAASELTLPHATET
jgi:signal transduction histidine kinase